jgi:hypothetical protein
MLASMSKVAQIIELSYKLDFLAPRGLWLRPGQSEDRGQVFGIFLITKYDCTNLGIVQYKEGIKRL